MSRRFKVSRRGFSGIVGIDRGKFIHLDAAKNFIFSEGIGPEEIAHPDAENSAKQVYKLPGWVP